MNFISYYGQAVNPFINYVRSEKWVRRIIDGQIEQTKREYCYDTCPALDDIAGFSAALMGKDVISCEIFAPIQDYPPHVDSCELTLAIPLTKHAILNVGGVVMKLEQWGSYVFNDGIPHCSSGIFLMVKVGDTGLVIKSKAES